MYNKIKVHIIKIGDDKMICTMIKKYKDEMIKDLQHFIQIESIEGPKKPNMPFGEKTNEALEFVLNKGDEFGFNTKNIDGYAGYVEVGKGEHMIGILGHVDVVPAGSGWIYPPFEGVVKDGKIYGRGAIDDKGPIISILYSMKILLENNLIKKNNRIRLILGTAEETSWDGIRYYVKKEEIPNVAFTPDANFPVIHGEKGLLDFDLKMDFKHKDDKNQISILRIDGGETRNIVPSKSTAKLFVPSDEMDNLQNKIVEFNNKHNLKVEAKYNGNYVELLVNGKASHASTPEKGINAISYMLLFLNNLNINSGDKAQFIKDYSNLIGLEYNGKSLNCAFHDKLSGNLTFNVGTIKLRDENVILECNIRYPISINHDNVIERLMKGLKNSSLKYFEYDHLKPIFFPKDDALINTMMSVYRNVTGDYETEPIVIGGATYARALPNTVAFGPVFPGQKELAHEPNEFLRIKDFEKFTEIYAKTILKLCK